MRPVADVQDHSQQLGISPSRADPLYFSRVNATRPLRMQRLCSRSESHLSPRSLFPSPNPRAVAETQMKTTAFDFNVDLELSMNFSDSDSVVSQYLPLNTPHLAAPREEVSNVIKNINNVQPKTSTIQSQRYLPAFQRKDSLFSLVGAVEIALPSTHNDIKRQYQLTQLSLEEDHSRIEVRNEDDSYGSSSSSS